MTKERMKLSRKGKWIVAIVGLILIAGIITILVKNKIIDEKKIEDFFHETNSIVFHHDDYDIHAIHPTLGNDELDNKILEMINTEIDNFKDEVDKAKKSKEVHELNISYKIYQHSSLLSIKFMIYKHLGTPEEDIKIYYFDNIRDKEIKYNELFKDQDKALTELSKQAIAKVKTDFAEYKDEEINKALAPTEDNFYILLFDDEQIILNVPKSNLANDTTGLIELKFDYADLNKYLTYIGAEKETESSQESPKPADPTTPPPPPVMDGERTLRDIETLKGKPTMMITFDDGPGGKKTERLLDELKKRDVKVTFFVLGQRIEMYPKVIKRAYLEGHTVASHTYDHKSLVKLDDEAIKNEIESTNNLLYQTIGITNHYVRPPYGATNKHVFELSDVTFIFWNIDPEDWKYKDTNTVHQNIMKGAKDKAISLTHDLYDTSIDGALLAIDDLLKQGYALISLEEAEKLGYIDEYTNGQYYSMKK